MRCTWIPWESQWASGATPVWMACGASLVAVEDAGTRAVSASIAANDMDTMHADAASWACASSRGWDRGADYASVIRFSRVWS